MDLNEWFQKGLTPNEYVTSMETHKEDLVHIYEQFDPPDDTAFFQELKNKNWRVIALTEDWCGDAMLNIPVLLRLAENADIAVRMILRDSHLELMDNYLTNGKSRSIPIFIFLNDKGEEVTTWGPRAEKIQQFTDETKAKLPASDAEDYQEKSRELLYFMSQTFRNRASFWNEVYDSLKNALQNAV